MPGKLSFSLIDSTKSFLFVKYEKCLNLEQTLPLFNTEYIRVSHYKMPEGGQERKLDFTIF